MLSLAKVSFAVGKKKILRDISFDVDDGEFLAITGPNGSGKSTLAKVIMGILPADEASKIFWGNENLLQYDLTERAKRGVAFAFQTPVKIKGVTVRRLLEVACGKNDVSEYLEMVGLNADEYLERELSSELSGGELKRIEIASILARNADLMIFDEPEAGIDIWSFDNLLQVFRRLKRQGKTIIVVTHQERLMKIADRIMLIVDGRVEKVGKSEIILQELKGEND
ncbi:ATP-binding cassette domain-containing protein [Candidatus Saccharibacteria bacterium]|nr:ATP-binding cassette domain-containing protein [Candidatus Saccharibacteria bacterium]